MVLLVHSLLLYRCMHLILPAALCCLALLCLCYGIVSYVHVHAYVLCVSHGRVCTHSVAYAGVSSYCAIEGHHRALPLCTCEGCC